MSSQTTRHADDKPAFARNFCAALDATGEKPEAFARRIDLTLRMVQRYRSGASEPTGARAVQIAQALGMTVEDLFTPADDETSEAA
jgi:transcriptional regulator with XRE-family HTH domain